MIKRLLLFLVFATVCISLSAQTIIYDDPNQYMYATTKSVVKDTFSGIDISDCSSITVSFDYEFALDWVGDGNMETPDECCISQNQNCCEGDPYNPQEGACDNCWDFLYTRMFIDGDSIYSELIGGVGTVDRTGTITLEGFCTVESTELYFEIWAQNWAADEWVRVTNIQVQCWDGMPEVDASPNPVCAGEDVQITTTTGTDFSPWSWDGPGGYSSSDRDPLIENIREDGAGVYTLTVEDENACEIIREVEIEVNPFPEEMPDLGPYCVTEGHVTLPGSIEGISGTWSGNGIDLFGRFVPADAGVGTHTLTFETWPDGCVGTVEVEVTDGGDLDPPALPSDLCELDDIIDLPQTISSVDGNWSGPGVSSNQFDPSDAGVGTHNLTFTPSNNDCVDPLTIQIEVNETPAVNQPEALEVCDDGSTINLTEVNTEITGGVTGVTVNWFTDAGLNDPINNPGAYVPGPTVIYATVDNGDCTSDAVSLTIYLIDDVDIFPIDPIEVCGDENGNAEINLIEYNEQVNGNSGNTVTWYSDAGLNNQIGNPGSYMSSGGTVYAVVSNSACTSAAEPLVITVLSSPVGTSVTVTECAGSGGVEYNLTELEEDVYAGGSDFAWFEDSDTTQVINNPGSYTTTPPATVYVVFTDGCRSEPVEVILDVDDEVDLGDLNDIEICVGSELFLSAPDIPSMSYEWTGPNGFNSTLPEVLVSGNADASHAGTYTLTGTIGDCSDEVSLQVIVHEEPDADIIIDTEILCASDMDGVLTAMYNGDGNPVSYTWSPAAYDNGQATINNLPSGTYEVTVVDDMGCEAFANIELTEPDALVLDCQLLSGVSGPGAEDAIVEIYVDGGISPYDLEWSGAATGSDFLPVSGTYPISDLPEGEIHFTIYDENGCEAECTLIIPSVDCVMTATIQQIREIECHGDETAEIEVVVENGSGQLTYEWNDSQYDGQNTLTGLSAGTYTVTVEDDQGCKVAATIEITEPDELTLSCDLIKGISGQGQEDAEVEISIVGGIEGYSVTWIGATEGDATYGGAGTYTIGDLPEGEITFTVTDENGCTAECNVTIPSVDCDIAASIEQIAEIMCHGDETAEIEVVVENGSGQLTYEWNDSQYDGQNTLIGIPAGTYFVTVTDENNCTAVSSIEIIEPELFTISCSVEENPTSESSNDGQIRVAMNGGEESFSVEYSGAMNGSQSSVSNPFIIEGLSAGAYGITVTDANGCQDSCELILNTADCDLTLSLQQIGEIKCYGDSTASIRVNTNAEGIITFNWSLDVNDKTQPSNLGAGTYSLTITDEETGCTESSTITIEEPDNLELICEVISMESEPGAEDGEVLIGFSGGTVPYESISWSGPGGNESYENPGEEEYVFTNLRGGSYSLTITDANGCQTVCSFVIKTKSQDCEMELEVSLIDSILCYGGDDAEVLVDIVNGTEPYTINWSDPSLDGNLNPRNLSAGTYSVTVVDSEGCEAEDLIVITEPEAIELICEVLVEVSADGNEDGEIRVNIDGGNPPFTLHYTGPQGGETLDDVDFPLVLENLSDGNYTFTVIDADGCEINCSTILNVAGCDLSVALIQEGIIMCHGDETASIRVETNTSAGILNFDWNREELDGKSNPSNLGAGTYSLTITDNATGCRVSDEITITEPEPLVLICNPNDESVQPEVIIEISGGTAPYDYTLEGPDSYTGSYSDEGQYIIDDIAVGNYDITLTDANGCTSTCTFKLVARECNLEVIVDVNHITCHGADDGSIELTINGAIGDYVVSWDDPAYGSSEGIYNLTPGVFSVTVTDELDCEESMDIVIYEPEVTEVMIYGDDMLCEGDTIYLVAIDTFETYLWNGQVGGPEYSVTQGGRVTLEVSNASGCVAFDTLDIVQLDTSLVVIRDTLCADGQLTVNGTIYDVNMPSGTEVISGGNRNGCDSTILVDLYFLGLVDIEVTDPNCEGITRTQVVIQNTGNAVLPYDIYYDGAFYETVETLPHPLGFPGIGDFTLRIVDDHGCTFVQDITIEQQEEISVQFFSDSVIVKGDTAFISAELTGPYVSFRWLPPELVMCDTCLITEGIIETNTIFTLEVLDEYGCVIEFKHTIIVTDGRSVYVPNAFSPNLDGVNDRFIIQMGPEVLGMKEMEVYDRWGNRVYREFYENSTRNIIGWNGKYRGRILNPDVFTFRVIVETKRGTLKNYTGTLTLIR